MENEIHGNSPAMTHIEWLKTLFCVSIGLCFAIMANAPCKQDNDKVIFRFGLSICACACMWLSCKFQTAWIELLDLRTFFIENFHTHMFRDEWILLSDLPKN